MESLDGRVTGGESWQWFWKEKGNANDFPFSYPLARRLFSELKGIQ